MTTQDPQKPTMPSVNWRRFAMLGSGVVTLAAIIRLAADHAGIARGTMASVVVSAATNAVIMLIVGIVAPYAQTGIPFAPLRRRIWLLIALALFSGFLNFLLLWKDL